MDIHTFDTLILNPMVGKGHGHCNTKHDLQTIWLLFLAVMSLNIYLLIQSERVSCTQHILSPGRTFVDGIKVSTLLFWQQGQ